jgi:hypothetical protein
VSHARRAAIRRTKNPVVREARPSRRVSQYQLGKLLSELTFNVRQGLSPHVRLPATYKVAAIGG